MSRQSASVSKSKEQKNHTMKPTTSIPYPQSSASNSSNAEAYQTLSTILDFPNEEQKLWWHSTAPMFAHMLQQSGIYDHHVQYRFLGLYKKCIIPFLGVYPTRENDSQRWMSILTRYGTPFELSLNCSQSIVRFTYEPINALTGAAGDPFNTHAIWDALSHLTPLQSIDLEWFQTLKADLTLNAEESAILNADPALTGDLIRTQNKLAMDLKPDGTFVVKTYIYPALKALATGRSIHDLIFDSVRGLCETTHAISTPLFVLEEYLHDRYSQENNTATPRLLSTDLLKPSSSRIKIYVLEESVSWSSVANLWTLGGRRNDASTLTGLTLLRELWDLIALPTPAGKIAYPDGFLSLDTKVNEQLPLMANFTLHHNDPVPEPQIYLTTFGMSDERVVDALSEFFERQGWEGMARGYRGEVCSYYPHADHASLNNVHAYISFSYRKDQPYLSTYLQSLETGDWAVSSFNAKGRTPR
ncbi:tryptophan dimethylallyltransferase fgaPT2 [Aspergillus undulatus]|uniref:tryptophan dimethylallyltransferase fgaPT2 n=1 Tax=Aspergillus undulatus TaxID=1810928 RepID=UPI003CCE2408